VRAIAECTPDEAPGFSLGGFDLLRRHFPRGGRQSGRPTCSSRRSGRRASIPQPRT
jgi:hypothetical protein